MDPFEVRFTQASIRPEFRDGRTIDDLAEALRSGTISPFAVQPIRVFMLDDTWFALDNRRLEAFRRAGVAVPFTLATESEIREESWKLTTRNEGRSLRVR